MAAKFLPTRYPGIYRRGERYVFSYRDANHRQRWQSARTLDDARRLKSAREADVARGEHQETSRLYLRDYLAEWIDTYQGRGRRGFRESTRVDYRRAIDRYVIPFFHDRLRRTISQVTPRDVNNFVGWLCDEKAQGRALSDARIRNIVAPLRSCLATAVDDGLLRHNPADKVRLPNRVKVREDDHTEPEARALSREQLSAFLSLVHPDHRLMFRLLASTGLRFSEMAALQWRHLDLDGSHAHVKVRRRLYRGELAPPKSKYGRRDVPLDAELTRDLRVRRRTSGWSSDNELVFASSSGTYLDHSNLRSRVLLHVVEEVGAPWAGFHTFRHTCASLLFERGANAVQVQRWLGHHSAAFTLATYVHLLSDTLGDPLELSIELEGVNESVNRPARTGPKSPELEIDESGLTEPLTAIRVNLPERPR